MTTATPAAAPAETLVQKIEDEVKKAESWVVAELQKAKSELAQLEADGAQLLQTAAIDVEGIFTWIANHQQQLQQVVQTAISGAVIGGAVDPALAPLVAPTVGALDAAEAAIDSLAQAKVTGSTPLSVLTNAYTATKAAANVATPLLTKAVSSTSTGTVVVPKAA